MIVNSDICNRQFEKALLDYRYHKIEDMEEQVQGLCIVDQILYIKNWIDNTQWDAEDLIRSTTSSAEEGMNLKRQIDGLNQRRTDMIEQLDQMIFDSMQDVKNNSGSRLSTETPAWAIDRLSILHIKIYQMHQETLRTDANEQHVIACKGKLEVLNTQKDDLSLAIDQLLTDMQSGLCQAKTYKQMKMYNDPELNPVLRNE